MNDIIEGVGELVVSLIIIAIPVLLVIGFYEDWYEFIKLILVMSFIGDFFLIGTIVHTLQKDE